MVDLFGKATSMGELSADNSILKFSGNYNRERVKVSIVIPTYKRSALLIDTVTSCEPIFNNSGYEIVVVFNARGESQEIIEFVKKHSIENIRVYENKENIGMFQNWNQGSLLSYGEWVSIMHDDDMFEPAYFEICSKLIKSVSERTAYINFNGTIVTNEHYADITKRSIISCGFRKATVRDVQVLGVSPFFATTCGTLVRKNILMELGGFDASTYPSGDVLFPIKLINNGYECYICSTKMNFYRKQINASLKKEVMEAFIYYYGELQKAIYAGSADNWLYRKFKECLEFKSVWHVFVQADENGVQLDSRRPDPSIERTAKYKIMDFYQRVYWRLKRDTMYIKAKER